MKQERENVRMPGLQTDFTGRKVQDRLSAVEKWSTLGERQIGLYEDSGGTAPLYRKVFTSSDWGPGNTITIAHGAAPHLIVAVRGTATNSGSVVSLSCGPYNGLTDNGIELVADATNVYAQSGGDNGAWTVTIEFLYTKVATA
jgi:hypothetical protein